MATRDVMLKVRVDRKLAARLERLARDKGATKSAVLREAIEIAEREAAREKARAVLISQAEEDQRRLKGRRPRVAKVRLG